MLRARSRGIHILNHHYHHIDLLEFVILVHYLAVRRGISHHRYPARLFPGRGLRRRAGRPREAATEGTTRFREEGGSGRAPDTAPETNPGRPSCGRGPRGPGSIAVAAAEGEPDLKASPNGFVDTGSRGSCARLGTESLVVGGMMSSMCVDATVRAAGVPGFEVTLAHDACAALDASSGGATSRPPRSTPRSSLLWATSTPGRRKAKTWPSAAHFLLRGQLNPPNCDETSLDDGQSRAVQVGSDQRS